MASKDLSERARGNRHNAQCVKASATGRLIPSEEQIFASSRLVPLPLKAHEFYPQREKQVQSNLDISNFKLDDVFLNVSGGSNVESTMCGSVCNAESEAQNSGETEAGVDIRRGRGQFNRHSGGRGGADGGNTKHKHLLDMANRI